MDPAPRLLFRVCGHLLQLTLLDSDAFWLDFFYFYLFILLRLGVTYIKNIEDNYKTRQGHHNRKNQLLWALFGLHHGPAIKMRLTILIRALIFNIVLYKWLINATEFIVVRSKCTMTNI